MKKLSLQTLFWVVLIFATAPAQAQEAAPTDYQAYKATAFANPKWDDAVKAGLEALEANQIDKALQNLNQAFTDGCRSPIVLFDLALIHEYQRSYYSAFQYYDLAREKFKQANTNHRYALTFDENYGRALYDAGRQSEAIPLLQKAAKKTQSFWLLKLVGMIAYDQGDTLNATSYFERAVRIESPEVTPPELVFIYTLLGRIFLNKGERDGSLRYYQKVLEFDAQNREAKFVVSRLQKSYEDDKMKSLLEDLKNF